MAAPRGHGGDHAADPPPPSLRRNANAPQHACDFSDDRWAERAGHHLHWFSREHRAWLSRSRNSWIGWSAPSTSPYELAAWQPWSAVRDSSEAPFVRWFYGALTNAAFNEVDRAALLGHASEPAFLSETLPPSTLTLRQLLLQSTLAASALRDDLQLGSTSRLAIYMPNHPQVQQQQHAAAAAAGAAVAAVAAAEAAGRNAQQQQ